MIYYFFFYFVCLSCFYIININKINIFDFIYFIIIIYSIIINYIVNYFITNKCIRINKGINRINRIKFIIIEGFTNNIIAKTIDINSITNSIRTIYNISINVISIIINILNFD